jgi:hypothetical protein
LATIFKVMRSSGLRLMGYQKAREVKQVGFS